MRSYKNTGIEINYRNLVVLMNSETSIKRPVNERTALKYVINEKWTAGKSFQKAFLTFSFDKFSVLDIFNKGIDIKEPLKRSLKMFNKNVRFGKNVELFPFHEILLQGRPPLPKSISSI